jgi:hypothetical protein
MMGKRKMPDQQSELFNESEWIEESGVVSPVSSSESLKADVEADANVDGFVNETEADEVEGDVDEVIDTDANLYLSMPILTAADLSTALSKIERREVSRYDKICCTSIITIYDLSFYLTGASPSSGAKQPYISAQSHIIVCNPSSDGEFSSEMMQFFFVLVQYEFVSRLFLMHIKQTLWQPIIDEILPQFSIHCPPFLSFASIVAFCRKNRYVHVSMYISDILDLCVDLKLHSLSAPSEAPLGLGLNPSQQVGNLVLQLVDGCRKTLSEVSPTLNSVVKQITDCCLPDYCRIASVELTVDSSVKEWVEMIGKKCKLKSNGSSPNSASSLPVQSLQPIQPSSVQLMRPAQSAMRPPRPSQSPRQMQSAPPTQSVALAQSTQTIQQVQSLQPIMAAIQSEQLAHSVSLVPPQPSTEFSHSGVQPFQLSASSPMLPSQLLPKPPSLKLAPSVTHQMDRPLPFSRPLGSGPPGQNSKLQSPYQPLPAVRQRIFIATFLCLYVCVCACVCVLCVALIYYFSLLYFRVAC